MLFSFFLKSKISYGITVCNEATELNNLLGCLISNISKKDQIIILADSEKVTNEVLDIIDSYKKVNSNIKYISSALNSDFSAFKNNLIKHATGDYLFQIDADELPNTYLLKNLSFLLLRYKVYDCFYVPRVNYVEGIKEEHIKQWKWVIDNKGRINYPDFQMRIFKLNKTIKWVNKVHEVLVNYKRIKHLPSKNENYCLFHHKNINKQEKQNKLYETLE